MVFTVTITARAERDIAEIVAGFADGGASWFSKLRAALTALDSHPTKFALADEADRLGLELREMLVGKRRGTYRVLFTISESTVNVHHIRLGSRGPIRGADLF